jgi:hypothetical protein
MDWCRKTVDGVRLHLDVSETRLLAYLGRQLRRMLASGDPRAAALRAFHPPQQRDRDPEAFASEMDADMDAALMRHRLERIDSMAAEMPDPEDPDGLTLVLGPERADSWLAYLADLRLLLGGVLGITTENGNRIGEGDPADWTPETRMYVFLSALQENLLQQILGDGV